MDLYDILEIKSNATDIEIKKAYLRLAKIYHPDKNKSKDASYNFNKIKSAYDILINSNTKNEYVNMSFNEKDNFIIILEKIINNEITINDINNYIKLNKSDIEYLEINFYNFFKFININELINLFKNGTIIKKKLFTITETESDINEDNEIIDNIEYLYNLPISFKINKLDINLELNINISDINNKKKIIIKRKIKNEVKTFTFIFNLSHPYILFYNYGDSNEHDNGDLIIKLKINNLIYWNENIILLEKIINLYDLIYGLNININLGNEYYINIDNWIPYIDGLLIEKYNIYKNNNLCNEIIKYNLAIKLYLNYEHTEEKKELLFNFFTK